MSMVPAQTRGSQFYLDRWKFGAPVRTKLRTPMLLRLRSNSKFGQALHKPYFREDHFSGGRPTLCHHREERSGIGSTTGIANDICISQFTRHQSKDI